MTDCSILTPLGKTTQAVSNGKMWFVRVGGTLGTGYTYGHLEGPDNSIGWNDAPESRFKRADAEKLILWACGNLMLEGKVYVSNGRAWLINDSPMAYEWVNSIKEFVSRFRKDTIVIEKLGPPLSVSEALMYGVKP